MDALIRRLASPQATSLSTLAIVFLFFVIGTSSVITFTATNATSLDLLVSAAMSVGVFGAIALSRTLLVRLADYRVRAGCILLVVVVANLMRILALDELLNQLEVTGTRTLLTRMASATFITLVGMIVVGELAARRERLNAVVAALTARSTDLSLAMASYADRLNLATKELHASIRTMLDPALSIVTREVGPASTTSMLTSARVIQETLRLSVRPMIDTLAEAANADLPETSIPDVTTSTSHSSQGTIDIIDSIRPVLGVVPLRIIGFPFIVAILPLGPALRAVLVLTLTWPMLSAIRRLWPARYRVLPTGRAVVVLTVTYLITVALPVLLFIGGARPFLNETFDTWKVTSLLIWAMGFFVANAWLASCISIFERSRRLTAERLVEVNDQIELSIARMRQQIWFTRRNLTWVLHGPVQSALVSAALRLESGETIGQAERIVIHDNIVEAYAKLNAGGPSYPDFDRFSTDLTGMWFGICEIEFCDPDALIGRLDTDPAGTASLIEIATESVSNAIRHGKATAISITVREANSGLVTLLISDNGAGLPSGSQPGIGSDLYASLAHEWSLTGSSDGTTLTAHVPWTPQEPKTPSSGGQL